MTPPSPQRLGYKPYDGDTSPSRIPRRGGKRESVSLHRMLAQAGLVHLDAPAGALGQDVVALVEHRRHIDDLVAPRHAVDIDLHDAEVRNGGAEMRADGAGEVAVEIVRRHVHL